MSPTERTLKQLRADGWRCAVVEKWNPHARIRQDLFGFVDILAIRGGETLAVQATSGAGGNAAARVRKIEAADALADVRAAGWAIQVWAWRKLKSGWAPRIVDVS